MYIINEDITVPTFLNSDQGPFIICLTTLNSIPVIRPTGSLTIMPGPAVCDILLGEGFVDDLRLSPGLIVEGALTVHNAHFKNYIPGQIWGNIILKNNSRTLFSNCTFENGGAGAVTYGIIQTDATSAGTVQLAVSGGIFINALGNGIYFTTPGGGNLAIDNVNFSNMKRSLEVGIQTSQNTLISINDCKITNYSITGMIISNGTVNINNCSFDGNNSDRWPVLLSTRVRINEDIPYAHNHLVNYNDAYSFVFLREDIATTESAYWGNLGLRYLIPGDIVIRADTMSNGSLTIGPGAHVSFIGRIILSGDVIASGTENNQIVFDCSSPGAETGGFAQDNWIIPRETLHFEYCIFYGLRQGINIWNTANSDGQGTSFEVNNCIFYNIKETAILLRGSVYNLNNSFIRSCIFSRNKRSAIRLQGLSGTQRCSVSVENCFIVNNADGAYLYYSDSCFRNCTFSGNTAHYAGGMHVSTGGSPCIVSCIIWDDTLFADYPQYVQLNYSCIQTTESYLSSFQGEHNIIANPMFVASDVPHDIYVNSQAPAFGNGSPESPFQTIIEAIELYKDNYSYALSQGSPCIGAGEGGYDMGASLSIWGGVNGNTPQGTADITIHVAPGTYTLGNNNMFHHVSLIGAGTEQTFINDCVANPQTGAVLQNVTITGSTKSGIVVSTYESPTIQNCIIKNNVGGADGGGIYSLKASPIIRNCLIVSNRPDTNGSGGGISFQYSSGLLENCTVCDNTAENLRHGGIQNNYSKTVIRNCIIYGNANGNFDNTGDAQTQPSVTYSLIQGGYVGQGNIDVDPLFADRTNGDYHEKSIAGRWNPSGSSWINDAEMSPCIDRGDPASYYSNEPQPNGTKINIGVYGNTIFASKSLKAPCYEHAFADTGNKVLSMAFNENIFNNTPNLESLKNAVQISSDGITFQHLGNLDNVVIIENLMKIILNEAIKEERYWLKIQGDTIKNIYGVVQGSVVTSDPIQKQHSSDPLNNWTKTESDAPGIALSYAAYGRSRFIAVGEGGTIRSSPDGTAWKPVSSPTQKDLRGVAFGMDKYVAVGNDGTIIKSDDGSLWDAVPASAATDKLNAVSAVRGAFVSVGDNGTIIKSADGVTWSAASSPTSRNLRAAVQGSDRQIAVGDNGTIISSFEGEYWQTVPLASTANLRGIAFSGSRYVAVGEKGAIFNSSDGVTWNEVPAITHTDINSVAYSNGCFVASGSILTSPDGLSWELKDTGTADVLNGVAAGDNFFVSVGNNGMILRSGGSPLQRGVSFDSISLSCHIHCIPDP